MLWHLKVLESPTSRLAALRIRAMRVVLLFALVYALLVRSAVLPISTPDQCQALPFEPETSLDLIQLNSSSNSLSAFQGDVIDLRMGCVYRVYRDIGVCPTSVYMTVVKIMLLLSVRGYLDSMEMENYRIPGYTDVMISIMPEGNALQVRHVILGLYKAVRMMTEQNHWKQVMAQLIWQEVAVRPREVGQIIILNSTMPILTGAAGEDYTTVTERSLPSTQGQILSNLSAEPLNGSAISTSLDAQDWELETNYRGARILPHTMFMALNTAFVRIAPFRASNAVVPFVSNNAIAGKTKLTIDQFDSSQDPNYFQYHNVALLLGELANRAFSERKFQEVDFVFKVGGQPVGKGSLERVTRGSVASEKA